MGVRILHLILRVSAMQPASHGRLLEVPRTELPWALETLTGMFLLFFQLIRCGLRMRRLVLLEPG